MKIYTLENVIQNYDWGDLNAIPDILGIPNSEQKPMAELWMGAHPKAPSVVVDGEKKIPLNEFIEIHKEDCLGVEVNNNYGSLPFLFKVLAAGSPLSIQAHPNLEQAKVGFNRENNEGIELTAFNRSYKDDNHKPEMMCALTEFYAMNGFRSVLEIENNLKIFEHEKIKKALSLLKIKGLKEFFSYLMNLSEDEKKNIAENVNKGLLSKPNLSEAERWSKKLFEIYPGDIGTLCPFFLNIVCLKPGEAMFLKAGQLHSYLQGTGIELMANSDNVLRGGLTPKFVDVSELLSVLEFQESKVEKYAIDDSELFSFPVFVNEFQLKKVSANNSNISIATNAKPAIAICTFGSLEITNQNQIMQIKKGGTIFVPAGIDHYSCQGSGELYIATTG